MNKIDPKQIKISDYWYDLPDERIAKFPLKQRDHSKLLVYKDGKIWHTYFYKLPQLLSQDNLLVINNTKVIYARLLFQKATGAKIEIFLLNPVEPAEYNQAFQTKGKAIWSCLIGNRKKWKQPFLTKNFIFQNKQYQLKAKLIGKDENGFLVEFTWQPDDITFAQLLDNVGLIPIPPYLNREAVPEDKTTYQTVYSKIEGSVAAPTAGLHFTDRVFQELKQKGIDIAEVTLHVGAGTFAPVKSETIGKHDMHTEYFTVELSELQKIRQKLGQIVAVGTTTLRTLESLYWLAVKMKQNPNDKFINQWLPYEYQNNLPSPTQALDLLINYLKTNDLERIEAWTQLIIVPGYKFKLVDTLITNFHQPQSTLLLLVAAFVGDDWKKIYQYALENDFRFLSYGDSSILFKNQQ